MAIERRKRMPDGTFGHIEKVGVGLTDKERVEMLEMENATLTYEAMVKEFRINDLETVQSEILFALMNGGLV